MSSLPKRCSARAVRSARRTGAHSFRGLGVWAGWVAPSWDDDGAGLSQKQKGSAQGIVLSTISRDLGIQSIEASELKRLFQNLQVLQSCFLPRDGPHHAPRLDIIHLPQRVVHRARGPQHVEVLGVAGVGRHRDRVEQQPAGTASKGGPPSK